MVAHGTPCLGPVTHAGCGAICPAYDRGCYGCYGPMEAPNTAALSARMAELGSEEWTWCASTAPSTPTPRRFGGRARRMSEGRSTRVIRTDYLARVEGEGAMYVRLDGREVAEVKLRIYEPPRFFEAFLRGRAFTEAPDITARICGICPVAYQMSAVRAMEDACGVAIDDGPLRDLRRLIYCGEWIESHSLHVYMLHAPDFLGYPGAVEMARDHREIVEQGLQMKKAGNALMALVGGREIHPINVRVGGFYRAPTRAELRSLTEELQRARETALATVRWAGELPFPDVRAARPSWSRSPIPAATRSTSGGSSPTGAWTSPAAEFDEHFLEEHVEHSNALHARIRERGSYLTGPLARYALSSQELRPLAREAAREAGLGPVCRNPFQSIVVRAVELVQACDEALAIIDRYEQPDAPGGRGRPAAGDRSRRHRGPARHALPPLRDRRRRHDPRRPDRAADLAEPAGDRGRPAGVVERELDLPDERALAALRAGDPQPRSVHLLRDALPQADGRPWLI